MAGIARLVGGGEARGEQADLLDSHTMISNHDCIFS